MSDACGIREPTSPHGRMNYPLNANVKRKKIQKSSAQSCTRTAVSLCLTRMATALPVKLVATGDTNASAPMRAARAARAIVLNMVSRWRCLGFRVREMIDRPRERNRSRLEAGSDGGVGQNARILASTGSKTRLQYFMRFRFSVSFFLRQKKRKNTSKYIVCSSKYQTLK